MPTLVGFGTFAALPEEEISEKIIRRILCGDQGMVVWWSIGAGLHVEPHSHANEQIVWMLKENPQDKPLRAVVRFAILGVSPSDILGFSVSQRSNLRRSQCAADITSRWRDGTGAEGPRGLGMATPWGHGQGPLSIY